MFKFNVKFCATPNVTDKTKNDFFILLMYRSIVACKLGNPTLLDIIEKSTHLITRIFQQTNSVVGWAISPFFLVCMVLLVGR